MCSTSRRLLRTVSHDQELCITTLDAAFTSLHTPYVSKHSRLTHLDMSEGAVCQHFFRNGTYLCSEGKNITFIHPLTFCWYPFAIMLSHPPSASSCTLMIATSFLCLGIYCLGVFNIQPMCMQFFNVLVDVQFCSVPVEPRAVTCTAILDCSMDTPKSADA